MSRNCDKVADQCIRALLHSQSNPQRQHRSSAGMAQKCTNKIQSRRFKDMKRGELRSRAILLMPTYPCRQSPASNKAYSRRTLTSRFCIWLQSHGCGPCTYRCRSYSFDRHAKIPHDASAHFKCRLLTRNNAACRSSVYSKYFAHLCSVQVHSEMRANLLNLGFLCCFCTVAFELRQLLSGCVEPCNWKLYTHRRAVMMLKWPLLLPLLVVASEFTEKAGFAGN